mmetsp:Transcript_18914/g.41117  ORF Transcript_18914/g.41117 Transcript_18914/m.41117 type:complete len:107 (-) Transcript_18914:1566-1886(-)
MVSNNTDFCFDLKKKLTLTDLASQNVLSRAVLEEVIYSLSPSMRSHNDIIQHPKRPKAQARDVTISGKNSHFPWIGTHSNNPMTSATIPIVLYSIPSNQRGGVRNR